MIETFDKPGHQVHVHAADELTVFLGESVERAVAELDAISIAVRLEPLLGQDLLGCDAQRGQRPPSPQSLAHLAAHRLSRSTGSVAQRLSNRDAMALRILDGSGQEAPDQLVATCGKADGELAIRPAIALGRAAGAWTASPGATRVIRLQQAVGDELVEVELGGMHGDADTDRRLLPADRTGLGQDEAIEPASKRLRQRCHALDLVGEPFQVSLFHPLVILTDSLIDER